MSLKPISETPTAAYQAPAYSQPARQLMIINLDSVNPVYYSTSPSTINRESSSIAAGNAEAFDGLDDVWLSTLDASITVKIDVKIGSHSIALGNVNATIPGVINIGINTFEGQDFEFNTQGEFFYSGSEAANNLIASIANNTGIDKINNQYIEGIVSYQVNTDGGGYLTVVQLESGGIVLWTTDNDDLTNTSPKWWQTTGLNSFQAKIGIYPSIGGSEPGLHIGLAGITLGVNDTIYLDDNVQVTGNLKIANGGNLQIGKTVFLPPTGDTSGTQDHAAFTTWLNNGYAIQLLPGTYYLNTTVEFPQGAVIRGVGKSGLGLTNVQTVIQATASMHAVLASSGWLSGSNTVAQETVTISDLKIDCNSLATHGIVTQNYDSLFEDLEIANALGDGLRFDVFSQSGSVQVTTTGVNNQVIRCTFQNCNRGLATNEAGSGTAVFTDGFITDCVVAGATGTAGICVQRSAGWKIHGNHLYGLNQHGIQVGQMFATNVTGNYIETWGDTSTAGLYRAIDGATIGQSDDGPASVISGNRIDLFAAPGSASTSLEGISILCDAANSANFSVTGNAVYCGPSTGWSTAHAFEYANAASTSVLTIASTGNLITGHWSGTIVQVPNGGTITVSAGS